MKSIKEIYRIGKGPSSSHTMGPHQASKIYLSHHGDAHRFHVKLYGSLAATGKGHLTDVAINEVLSQAGPVEIEWLPRTFLESHPNAMSIAQVEDDGSLKDEWTFYSVGGGAIRCEQLSSVESPDIYPLNTMNELLDWCNRNGKAYWEYVEEIEDSDINDYLFEVWKAMQESIERGLDREGVLPGPLHLRRKAASRARKGFAAENLSLVRKLVL